MRRERCRPLRLLLGDRDLALHVLGRLDPPKQCFAIAQLQYQPVVTTVLDLAVEFGEVVGPRALCNAMTSMANENLYHTSDVMISILCDMSTSMEGLFDYLLCPYVDDAGRCSNFYTRQSM